MSLYYSGFFLGVDTTNYETDDGDYIDGQQSYVM